MPDSTADESYPVTVAADMPGGVYDLSVGLFDTTVTPERVIEVGLRANLRDAQGYYHLAALNVGQTPVTDPDGCVQPRKDLPVRLGPACDLRGRRCHVAAGTIVRLVDGADGTGRLVVGVAGNSAIAVK